MDLEDEPILAELTVEELRLGELIANLAEDPTDEARGRIMAAVRNGPIPAKKEHRRTAMGRGWRLTLVGLGFAGLLLGGSAAALAASSDALPDSPGYGLRRFEENLRIAVTAPAQQPRLYLQFAADKVRQARAEILHGHSSGAAKLLSDSREDLQQAQGEFQNVSDPSERLSLSQENSSIQADQINEENQLEGTVKGDNTKPAPRQPSPTPSVVPSPSPQGAGEPEASPDGPSSQSDGGTP